jgi:hypothetical protein
MTKQRATVMWEHYEAFTDAPRVKSFLGYTFETRMVYHNSRGYFVRLRRRREARPVGRSKPPTKFKVLGSTTYRDRGTRTVTGKE